MRSDFQVRLWVSKSSSNIDRPQHPTLIPHQQEAKSTQQPVGDASLKLSPLECSKRTETLMTYIASMCIVMPTLLVPVWILDGTTRSRNARLGRGASLCPRVVACFRFANYTWIPTQPRINPKFGCAIIPPCWIPLSCWPRMNAFGVATSDPSRRFMQVFCVWYLSPE